MKTSDLSQEGLAVVWLPCRVWVRWPNETQQLCILEDYEQEPGEYSGMPVMFGVVTPPGWKKSLRVPIGWLGDTC
jgi:hypothetical protein